ncbi:hypothetical protein FHS57_002108 [Runella defluvii]|uniref:Uncharacterized protein n=1 Tax=Runella defluvii TaxID=370973 RepID=A0A7W5ZJQ1_9BACT|nr:hypothetical protein [Runella defluvii]
MTDLNLSSHINQCLILQDVGQRLIVKYVCY